MHKLRLRLLRQAKGLTLDQLSLASGVHRGTIHRIEQGQVSPRVETLRQLCAGLGSQLHELFPDPLPPERADSAAPARIRHLEQQLAASENRYRALLGTLPELFLRLARDSGMQTASGDETPDTASQ